MSSLRVQNDSLNGGSFCIESRQQSGPTFCWINFIVTSQRHLLAVLAVHGSAYQIIIHLNKFSIVKDTCQKILLSVSIFTIEIQLMTGSFCRTTHKVIKAKWVSKCSNLNKINKEKLQLLLKGPPQLTWDSCRTWTVTSSKATNMLINERFMVRTGCNYNCQPGPKPITIAGQNCVCQWLQCSIFVTHDMSCSLTLAKM